MTNWQRLLVLYTVKCFLLKEDTLSQMCTKMLDIDKSFADIGKDLLCKHDINSHLHRNIWLT